MKTTITLSLIALVAGFSLSSVKAEDESPAAQAKLLGMAKISKKAAEATAIAKVPSGTVKGGELEQEKGLLIWSFDITTPNTKDITEVNVDAITGKVVGVDVEKPEAQKKEADEDAKK